MTQQEILELITKQDKWEINISGLLSILSSLSERIEVLEGKKKLPCETCFEKDGHSYMCPESIEPYIGAGDGKMVEECKHEYDIALDYACCKKCGLVVHNGGKNCVHKRTQSISGTDLEECLNCHAIVFFNADGRKIVEEVEMNGVKGYWCKCGFAHKEGTKCKIDPTQPEDWEKDFADFMDSHKAFDYYHRDMARAFIKSTIEKERAEWYKKGFTDGFDHSGEGYNGEYTGKGLPKDFLEKAAEESLQELLTNNK